MQIFTSFGIISSVMFHMTASFPKISMDGNQKNVKTGIFKNKRLQNKSKCNSLVVYSICKLKCAT